MPPVRRSRLPSLFFRLNPLSRPANQPARPNPEVEIKNMSWPTYVSYGRDLPNKDQHTQRLMQKHYKRHDIYGGIDAFNRFLIDTGIETSNLIKPGGPLEKWVDNHTVDPVDAFGAPMAERVNTMTRGITGSTSDKETTRGRRYYRVIRYISHYKKELDGLRQVAKKSMGDTLREYIGNSSILRKTLPYVSTGWGYMGTFYYLKNYFDELCGWFPCVATPISYIFWALIGGAAVWQVADAVERYWNGNVPNLDGTEDDNKDDGDVVDGPEGWADGVLSKCRQPGERNVSSLGGAEDNNKDDGDVVDGPEGWIDEVLSISRQLSERSISSPNVTEDKDDNGDVVDGPERCRYYLRKRK